MEPLELSSIKKKGDNSIKCPLISIGMTYYNAADTIEKAVVSALAQTWTNIEIIIVDDHSHDDQEHVLEQIKRRDSRIRIMRHVQNKGVAASRNTIISHAKGEFIAFFDDDDESVPERLEKQYMRIKEYENEHAITCPVICYTARLQRYPDGKECYEATMGMNEGRAPHGEAVALRILTGKPQRDISGSAATCSQMARRSTYLKLGGFDEAFRRSEDTEFNIKAAMQDGHFVGIDEALVVQTMTLSSEKTLVDEKHYMLKLLEKYKAFIKKHSHYLFCHQWIDVKYDFLQRNTGRFGMKMLKLSIMHPVLTLQRLMWALPNIRVNVRCIRFHHDKK